MMYTINKNKESGFSLTELAIVVIIIGLLIGGIVIGQRMVSLSILTTAKTLTNSSPVSIIEDLTLWLEATSNSSFNKSEKIDGLTITDWYDINPQSTLKNNVTQQTAEERPTYSSRSINSLPTISFDGDDNGLEFSTNDKFIDLPNTIFLVAQLDATGSQNFIGRGSTTTNGLISFRVFGSSLSYALVDDVAIPVVNISSPSTGTPFILTANASKENNVNIALNGNSFTQSALTVSTGFDNNSGFSTALGKRADDSWFLDGNIGEIIIYNRILSDFERDQVEEYLSKKWKIKLD